MDVDQVVLLGRMMLQEVIILAGPILAVADRGQPGGQRGSGAHFAAGHDHFFRRPPAGHRRRAVFRHALDVASSRAIHARHVFRFSCVPAMIEIPLVAIITALLTIGVRLTGLMLFAPFFGSAVIPARIKAVWSWR